MLSLVTPPVSDPVLIGEVKRRLRMDGDDGDHDIADLIGEATAFIDGYHGVLRPLITQTWRMTCASFGARVELPAGVQSISSVAYYDSDGVDQAFADFRLMKDGVRSWVEPETSFSWPATDVRGDAVRIDFVAGYGDEPKDIPAHIKSAIIALVGYLDGNRGDEVTAIPPHIFAMLGTQKQWL